MMGLGILGRGVNVAKFLAERRAELTITDLKTEEQLASSLKQLKNFPTSNMFWAGTSWPIFQAKI